MAMQLPKKPVIPMNKIQTYSKAHDTMFMMFDSWFVKLVQLAFSFSSKISTKDSLFVVKLSMIMNYSQSHLCNRKLDLGRSMGKSL